MSSTMASAVRNTLRATGTRSPSSASTPRAKAMSVAIGMPQPATPSRPRVEGQVDQRGNHRPAQGGGDGQRRAAHGGQLAHEHLALDLQPDDQEEDRHEPVVDPMRQVLGQREVADADSQFRMPQRRVALRPRASWPRRGPRPWRRSGRYRPRIACRRSPGRGRTILSTGGRRATPMELVIPALRSRSVRSGVPPAARVGIGADCSEPRCGWRGRHVPVPDDYAAQDLQEADERDYILLSSRNASASAIIVEHPGAGPIAQQPRRRGASNSPLRPCAPRTRGSGRA